MARNDWRRIWWAHLVLALLGLALGVNAVYRAGPTERTDLPVYLEAGRHVLEGREPFGATSDRGWSYYYPPTLAVLVTPLTPLPQRAAAAVWYAVSVCAFTLGVVGCRRAAGRTGPLDRADAAALALVFLPTASALLRGQVGPLLLGLAGGALWALVRGRWALAGLLVSLATAIKLTPGLLLVGLLIARRWRAFGAGVAGLVLWLVLVPAPFLGVEGALASSARVARVMVVGPALEPDRIEMPAARLDPHIPNNQSLASQAIRRTSGWAERVLLLALAGGLLGLTLPLAARGAREARAPSAEAWALLLAAPLLVAPVAWHHHHVLLYPALLALALAPGPAARRALGSFAVLSLLHFVVKPLRPYGLLGWGTLGVTLTLAGTAWRAVERGTSTTTAKENGR